VLGAVKITKKPNNNNNKKKNNKVKSKPLELRSRVKIELFERRIDILNYNAQASWGRSQKLIFTCERSSKGLLFTLLLFFFLFFFLLLLG
jgi:hypothetical protein